MSFFRRRMIAWRPGAILLFCLLCLSLQVPVESQTSYLRASRLGITFISSLDHPANDLRYQRALLLGAAWNRWPLYWDRVEHQPGVFDWTGYDRLVSEDMRHGLLVDAILLGRPGFRAQGGSIDGLNNPIFNDGSDTPGPGKSPNPANFWASFVYQAVMRYKPGGLLALQQGWLQGQGVTVWEIWNEPDLTMFWSGSPEEYARLLKVAYLTAHSADPNTQVMFGGLAYGNPDDNDWLAKVLAIYTHDPGRSTYNWYMDIVGVHNYTYARRTGLVVRRIEQVLAQYGLGRRVWVTESGVPVWDDYPGPTWAANDPTSRRLRATMEQQAAFVAESTVYAWAAGADVVFIHQLYDDCGNQAGGTNFPPHNGDLCTINPVCAGDAYGLYRNDRGEACFSLHTLPGTPRPAAGAFYRLAQIFGAVPFNNGKIESPNSEVSLISFDRPSTNERILVMWNRRLAQAELKVDATSSEAQLYAMDNQDWLIAPSEGQYTIGLAPATRDDYPYLPSGEASGIGGPPFIMVERVEHPPASTLEAGLAEEPLSLTPGSITATQPPRPTVDPALDIDPPLTSMTPLPLVSPATFTVYWSGEDNSGIQKFLIWVRANGGSWQPWLETKDGQGQYTGTSGSTYEFAAWAQDLAGNWSPNVDLQPQTITTVQ